MMTTEESARWATAVQELKEVPKGYEDCIQIGGLLQLLKALETKTEHHGQEDGNG